MEKTNDVLKFAKQGNPKAIEAIFSKQLSASNIAVKAVVRDGCLQIMFEAKQALSQVTMVNGVKKVLTAIKPENIQTVKVYSKQSGDDFPKWHEEFELAEKEKVDNSPNNDLAQTDVTNQQKIENSEVEILSEEKTSSTALSESDIALEYIVANINDTFRQNGLTISVSTATIPSIVNGYLEITVVSKRPLREESETIKNIIINTIENELNNPDNEYFGGVNITFISLRGKEHDDSWQRELYRKPQVQAQNRDGYDYLVSPKTSETTIPTSDSNENPSQANNSAFQNLSSNQDNKYKLSQNKNINQHNFFRPAYSYLISTLLIMFSIPSCQSVDNVNRGLFLFWSGTILGAFTILYEVGENSEKEKQLVNNKVAKIIQKLKADDPSFNPIKKGDYGQSNDFSFAIIDVSYANSVTGNMFGFPKKIDITGKAAIVELAVWNHRNFNSLLNFRSFTLVDDRLNRYSNHGNSGAVSEYRGGISNTTDLRPNNIFKFYVVFDINPDSYAVFLETAEGSSSGGCLTFSLASEVIIPSSNSNDNIGTRTNSKLNSLANQYLDALSTQKERFSSAKNSATESSELINTNEKPHVNKLTKKSISIVSGVLVTCIVLSWLGWTLYQRSTYESLLTSAQKITANVSSNNIDSENLDAKQKDIDAAFLLLYKIPSDSGDIYQRAKKTWSDLEKLNFQNAKLYAKRGGTRLGVDNQSAIEDFDKAITYNPNYAEAYFARGAANTLIANSQMEKGQQGDFRAVRLDLQKAVELFGQQEKVEKKNQALTLLKKLDELMALQAKEDANKASSN